MNRKDLTTGEAEAYEAGWRAAEATMRQRALEAAPTAVAVWVTTYLAHEAHKPASGDPGAKEGDEVTGLEYRGG